MQGMAVLAPGSCRPQVAQVSLTCNHTGATCLCFGVLVALVRVLGTEPAQPVSLRHLISRACSTAHGRSMQRCYSGHTWLSKASPAGRQASSGALEPLEPCFKSCKEAVARLCRARGCAHHRPRGHWRPPHSQYPAHSGWNAAGQPSQQIRSPPNLGKRGSRVAGPGVRLYGKCRVCAQECCCCAAAAPAALAAHLHAPQHSSLLSFVTARPSSCSCSMFSWAPAPCDARQGPSVLKTIRYARSTH